MNIYSRGVTLLILLAVPIVVCGQTIAGSLPKGKELLSDCRIALQTGDKTKEGAVCIAFIQGYSFGVGFGQVRERYKSFCINGDMEMRAVIQRVVRYLETLNAIRLDEPAPFSLMRALEEAYPCR